MIRAARYGAFTLLMMSIAVSASAQTAEISGVAGFTPAVTLERHAAELTDLKLSGGFTWGIQGARFFTPRWGAEIVLTRQTSALEAVTPAGAAELYRITLAQLQANVVYQFGDDSARLRPFVFGGVGATFFSARDLESASKASFGLGGGVKYFPWKTIGLRSQMGYKPIWLNDDPEAALCGPFGFCQAWLTPIELTAGVIIRF